MYVYLKSSYYTKSTWMPEYLTNTEFLLCYFLAVYIEVILLSVSSALQTNIPLLNKDFSWRAAKIAYNQSHAQGNQSTLQEI